MAGRPSCRAASRTPRSPGRNASGSPRPRRAIVSTLHGPSPGSAASRARACCQSLPTSRSISPLARAAARALKVAWRARGRAREPGSAAASAAGLGNRCVSPPAGSSAGSPCAATSRAAWVRAAAVDTCWPSTTRTANSAGSTVRGTRRPGALRTSGASTASCAQQVGHRHRVGVQVEQPAAPADRVGQIAQVGQGQQARRRTPARAAAPRPPARAAAAACAGRPRPATPRPRAPRSRPDGRTGCRGPAATGTAAAAAASPGRRPGARGRARRRSSVGGSAKTSRTVSLNARMLAKPGREGDVAHRQRGGLDQQPGGLRPLRPGQGQRPGAQLGQQLPLDLPDAVAEPGRPGRGRPRGR